MDRTYTAEKLRKAKSDIEWAERVINDRKAEIEGQAQDNLLLHIDQAIDNLKIAHKEVEG